METPLADAPAVGSSEAYLTQSVISALKFYTLPTLFNQNSLYCETDWFEPMASAPTILSKPFANSDLKITLWGLENDERLYRRKTSRMHIDTAVGVSDCMQYIEMHLHRSMLDVGLERTAKLFHIPITTLRGLMSMRYLPLHLFPPESPLSLLVQQGLFESYLTHIAERKAGSRQSTVTKEEDDIAKTMREGDPGDDDGMQQVLTPSGATYYPKKFKEMILEQLLSGKRKVAHLAKEYRLYTSIINNWKRSYMKQKVVESSKSLSCNTTKEIRRGLSPHCGPAARRSCRVKLSLPSNRVTFPGLQLMAQYGTATYCFFSLPQRTGALSRLPAAVQTVIFVCALRPFPIALPLANSHLEGISIPAMRTKRCASSTQCN